MICPHCHNEIKQRTSRQNSSLHLWFTQISDELINQGTDLRELVKNGVDIIPTPEALKVLFKQLVMAMYQKESTTQLTIKELNAVCEVFNKILAERAEIHIPFPSEDTLSLENIK